MGRMRTVGIFAMAVAMSGMALAACSSSKSSSNGSTTTSANGAVTGGTLKLVGQGDVDNLDTADGYYTATYTVERAFTRQLYTYLTTPTLAGQVAPVPDLATALPTITGNGTIYTITIRQGVMWNTSPPRQVTAADEVLGMKRLCNSANPTPAVSYFTATIAGMAAYCTGFANVGQDATSIANYINANNISGVQATGPETVQFTLTQPANDFINILAMPFSSPAPVEYLAHVPGSTDEWQHTISDGPYFVASYTPTVSFKLLRNTAWSASTDTIRKAYVNEIDVTEGVADAATALLQIQAGTSDMEFDQNVPIASLAGMVANHDPNLLIGPDGNNYITVNPYLVINLQSPNNNKALANPLVRQALEYAMNKTAISQVYGGAAISRPLNQVVPPGSIGNVSGYNPYPTPNDGGDATKAKALLAQAGYQPGQVNLKLVYRTNTQHTAVAQTDEAALQAAGFAVTLVAATPANTFYTNYLQNPTASTSGAWDIAEAGWSPDWLGNNGRSMIAVLFDGRTYGKNSVDYGDYNSATTNALIDKALAAPTVQQATTFWQQAAQQIMTDAVIVPLGAQKVSLYHSTRVQNCSFYSFSENCDVTNVWIKP